MWESQKEGDMGKDLEKPLSSMPHSTSTLDKKNLIGFPFTQVGWIVFFKMQFQK